MLSVSYTHSILDLLLTPIWLSSLRLLFDSIWFQIIWEWGFYSQKITIAYLYIEYIHKIAYQIADYFWLSLLIVHEQIHSDKFELVQ